VVFFINDTDEVGKKANGDKGDGEVNHHGVDVTGTDHIFCFFKDTTERSFLITCDPKNALTTGFYLLTTGDGRRISNNFIGCFPPLYFPHFHG
jgi:hypothetical protein